MSGAAAKKASKAAVARILEVARARLAPRASAPPPPPPQAVASAVATIAAERNGYLAWSFYVALRQAEVAAARQWLRHAQLFDDMAAASVVIAWEMHAVIAAWPGDVCRDCWDEWACY